MLIFDMKWVSLSPRLFIVTYSVFQDRMKDVHVRMKDDCRAVWWPCLNSTRSEKPDLLGYSKIEVNETQIVAAVGRDPSTAVIVVIVVNDNDDHGDDVVVTGHSRNSCGHDYYVLIVPGRNTLKGGNS